MPLLSLGLFAIACAGGAALGTLIVVEVGGISLPAFWPLSGILLGALLLTEPRRWMPYLVTASAIAMMVAMFWGRQPVPAAVFALVVAAEGAAAAWLLKRSLGMFSVTHVAHVLAFVCVAALVPMAGGIVVAVLLRTGDGPWFAVWRAWWLMNALGMVTAPIVVAAVTASTTSIGRPRRLIELTAMLTLAGTTSVLVFGGMLSPLLRVPAYTLPFFLWPALRFGVGGTAMVVLVMVLSPCLARPPQIGFFARRGRPPSLPRRFC
jgi:integral membrane sensor domain MASE1